MIRKEKNGVKLTLDTYLDGMHVFRVFGAGVEPRKFIGYENEWKAWMYFAQCTKEGQHEKID